MWCKSCQQDVPAIGSTDESSVRCARCNKSHQGETASAAPTTKTKSVDAASTDWLEKAFLDDWEFEDDLNDAEQLVASFGVASYGAASYDTGSYGSGQRVDSVVRFDDSHTRPSSKSLDHRHSKNRSAKRHKPARSSFFSWSMLSLGLMAFVFGAVLIGWSFIENRPDLWRLGMPFTLIGQAALIVGLVFQLDGLWKNNREASETLNQLDSQIDELRHATTMLTTTHSSPAQSFYSHMANGASPNLLLADLKGQLDLLANRMADER